MNSIPAGVRRLVVFRAGDRCEYCGLAQEGQEATFHIDQFAPRKLFEDDIRRAADFLQQCEHQSHSSSGVLDVTVYVGILLPELI